MKQFRFLLPLLVLALVLSACESTAPEPYIYSVSTSQGDVSVTVDTENCTITDGKDVYRYTVSASGHNISYDIIYPNGATYYWTTTQYGGTGGWTDDYDETRYIRGNILIDALEYNQPRERSGNPLLGILLIGLGLFNCFAPETAFFFSKGWMFRDAEPSEAYLEMTRIGGGIVIFIGVLQLLV